MNKGNNIFFLVMATLLVLVGCSSQKSNSYAEEPPGFFGRVKENTFARFNGFYNADLIYTESQRESTRGYSDDYASLLPLSVADALAEEGALEGEMDAIIAKTATNIDKHVYTKWLDDNYLLNGIAHYIKGDYEMAGEIFAYTSSEFKNGVDVGKQNARQKSKGPSAAELKKQQFKEKQRAANKAKKAAYEATKNRKKEAKEKNKENDKRKKESSKPLTREEQFKAKQKAKAEGRDVTTEEIVDELTKEREDEASSKIKEKNNKAAKDKIRKSPKLVNSDNRPEGFLKHPLAGKDAILWMAKNYITQEDFVAAQHVLTLINEDAEFPKRLDKAFYLVNADMHLRLDNMSRAIEYVHSAIESTKVRKEKARLHYILGQLYREIGDNDQSIANFDLVEKYKPTYDMIYHARRQSIEQRLEDGTYDYNQLVAELKKMTKDEKNNEFLDHIFYDLGKAYAYLGEVDKSVESFEKSLENNASDAALRGDTHMALGDMFYSSQLYKEAGPQYASALLTIDNTNSRYGEVELYAEALKTINEGFENIALKDSVLILAELPKEEVEKIVKNRVNELVKADRKKKLQELNNSGSAAFTGDKENAARDLRKRNKKADEKAKWYFYDLNQSASGFTSFRQTWGDRPLRDGWRRYDYVKRFINDGRDSQKAKDLDKLDLFSTYMAEIPFSSEEKLAVKESIEQSRLEIGKTFIDAIGDNRRGVEQLELLVESNPAEPLRKEAYQYLYRGYILSGDVSAANKYSAGATTPDEAMGVSAVSDELETMYNRAYNAFLAEDYNKAISVSELAEKSFSSNALEDKFAFIKAMSMGKLNQDNMEEELTTFMESYKNSPLKERARLILEQME